ncbi:hypothetical protein GCM10025331_83320 [Actinoplanes utahensis]|nr:hypothetical protein Aut01nite_84760 [Actinoplanes utahensis]
MTDKVGVAFSERSVSRLGIRQTITNQRYGLPGGTWTLGDLTTAAGIVERSGAHLLEQLSSPASDTAPCDSPARR